MPVCPRGHQSRSADYCDECGTPIGGPAAPSAPAASSAQSPAPSSGACPDCGTPSSGRFCEVCGHDFLMAKLSPAGSSGVSPGAGGAGGPSATTGTFANPVITEMPPGTAGGWPGQVAPDPGAAPAPYAPDPATPGAYAP